MNPEKVLREVCTRLDIRFDKSMLSWEPGKRKEDGPWADYWYHSVHKSTGFIQSAKKEEQVLEDRLVSVYEEVLPYYNQLFEKAIKA